MRYVKGHGLQTRRRIVENASYGLRQSGADGMSVVDLMKLAGLTHGGFYSHFDSREALVIEAFAQAMDRTVADWLKIMKGMPVEIGANPQPTRTNNAVSDFVGKSRRVWSKAPRWCSGFLL